METKANKKSPAWVTIVFVSVTLVGLICAIYAQVHNFGFINFDDPYYVSQNPAVRNGLTKTGVIGALTQAHAANWHPLTWISHMLDCELFGLNPGAHHLVNVTFHAANTVLLLCLMWQLTGAVWRSALVAALFALHPAHVESVAWISERKDMLSTFFGLLTLMCYAKYVNTQSVPRLAEISSGSVAGSGRTAQRAWWYGAALLSFALGLMSKPMLVTWPFVMLLLDVWPMRRVDLNKWRTRGSVYRRLVFEKFPFFGLTVVSSLITLWVQSSGGAVATLQHTPLTTRLLTALSAYGGYLQKTFWPVDLSVMYVPPESWDRAALLASAVVLGLISAAAWRQRVNRPYILTGWFWYLGTLVPVIGLVQVGNQVMADRYTYIPLIGLFVIAAWLGEELVRNRPVWRKVMVAGLVMALGACSISAWRQTSRWRDSVTLFTHALHLDPNNFVIHFTLGTEYMNTDRHELAESHFQQALRLRPYYGDVLNNMGVMLTQQGRTDEALTYLFEAVRVSPKYGEAYGKLAFVLAAKGRYAEAIRYYREALKLRPELVEALNNLAWLFATHPSAEFRDGSEAVRLAQKACELTGTNEAIYIGTLAAAYAEAGRYREAVAAALRARETALSHGETNLATRNTELMEFYRAEKPFREPVKPPAP